MLPGFTSEIVDGKKMGGGESVAVIEKQKINGTDGFFSAVNGMSFFSIEKQKDFRKFFNSSQHPRFFPTIQLFPRYY